MSRRVMNFLLFLDYYSIYLKIITKNMEEAKDILKDYLQIIKYLTDNNLKKISQIDELFSIVFHS